MIFDIDKQTVKDLELFSDSKKEPSVYNFYSRTATIGGREALYEMFSVPVSDLAFLQDRIEAINFFNNNSCFLNLHSRQLDYVEFYLQNRRFPLRDNIIDATYNGIANRVSPDSDYYIITEGIFHIIQFLYELGKFIKEVESLKISSFLDKDFDIIKRIINSRIIIEILKNPPKKISDLSYLTINKLDRFFRVIFYAEVKRVKDILIKINPPKKLFIIFDELFRGTNVKDAYDASLMIIKALTKIRDNLFIISTHILEVAENIDNKNSIMFRCFESDLIDQQPAYDYKLKDGITKERIGLLIIENERIPEILDQIEKKQNYLL
jgi:hypothetical protein